METNPWMIMLINMTIVFGVLILLGVLMKIIYLIDPTRKRAATTEEKNITATSEATAAPVESSAVSTEPSQEIIAVIMAAISSLGYSSDKIASIKPVLSRNWKLDGRIGRK